MCSITGYPMIAGLAHGGVGVRAETTESGPFDPDEAQLAQRLGDRVGIVSTLAGRRRDGIAGPLTDALDARRGVAFEDRAVFGKGDALPCRVLSGCQSSRTRRALRRRSLAVELERHAQLHQALHLALAGDDPSSRRRDRLCRWPVPWPPASTPPRSYGRRLTRGPRGSASACAPLLHDLRPRAVGDWSELAVKVIHRFPCCLPEGGRCQANHRSRGGRR